MWNGCFESEAERKEFYARQEAFWNRPEHEVLNDLVWRQPLTRQMQVQPSIVHVISLDHWRATHKARKQRQR
jgi:hypothetical protein